MRNWNWGVFVEASGAIAIIAGLVFVGLQMRQEQAISIAELQQELIASRIALSELESSHADLLIKANSGEALTATEESQHAAPHLAEVILHRLGHVDEHQKMQRLRFGWLEAQNLLLVMKDGKTYKNLLVDPSHEAFRGAPQPAGHSWSM